MKRHIASTFVTATLLLVGATTALAGPYRYETRAQCIFAKNDAGPLYGLGVVEPLPHYQDGSAHDRGANSAFTDMLWAGSYAAHTEQLEGLARSTARVDGLRIVPGLAGLPDLISAKTVKSITHDTADGIARGRTFIEGFKFLGVPYTVGDEPNQKMTINVAGLGKVQLAFNVQTTFDDGTMNTVAMRVIMPTGVMIEVAKTQAGSIYRTTTPGA